MTHIEKMKQWLEALKVVNSCIDDYYLPKEKAWLPEIEQAITSLRQAIAEAEAEKHEPVACEKCGKAIKDGKVKCVQGRNCWVGQQPAQRTEQEPQSVRERWNIERDGDDLLVCFNDHDKSQACTYARYVPAPQRKPIQNLQCFHCQDTIETLNDKVMQLMAKRTWVGLTDEELRIDFGKLYPSDIGILELAENNKDYAVEAIGARVHWTAFKDGARAGEAKLKQKNGYAEENT